ncbi:MAG: putative Mrr restriction endonuclease [Gemmatimonadetes bacterium]|nr:putative Mrr restriction endonuclease [Gemmatimonadota bacterium]
MNPTLAALRELGGSASIAELGDKVIDLIKPSKDVLEAPHGSGRRTELEYRLAWARTYLKKYGLVTNSAHGVWALTPKASETESVDTAKVAKVIRSARGASKPRRRRRVPLPVPETLSDEPDVLPDWREALTAALLAMLPAAFERLCQRLLRESGFIEVEVTGRSGDGGIDGHGIIRVAGLISFPVMFQCKRYKGNAGSAAVRDFRGAMMGRADKGLIISTGGFTRDARAEATRDGAPPIDLIDGDLLADKLKELNLGVRTRQVEEVDVETAWFRSL